MFRENLRRLVESTDGAIAGILMGFDGIAVESFSNAPGGDPAALDIANVGMEFSFVLTQVRKAAEILELGPLEEVALRTEKFTLLLRIVSGDYFVALAIHSSGNLGKGRFLLRTIAPKFQHELV